MFTNFTSSSSMFHWPRKGANCMLRCTAVAPSSDIPRCSISALTCTKAQLSLLCVTKGCSHAAADSPGANVSCGICALLCGSAAAGSTTAQGAAARGDAVLLFMWSIRHQACFAAVKPKPGPKWRTESRTGPLTESKAPKTFSLEHV